MSELECGLATRYEAGSYIRLCSTNLKKIIVGFGLGLVLQQPTIAAQTVLPDVEVSIGLSLLSFIIFLGGSVFVTVSQTLLEKKLIEGLEAIIPNLDPSTLADGGATTLRSMVSDDKLSAVLDVYNDSIRSIWYLAFALSCLTFVASLGMEWKSVKQGKAGTDQHGEEALGYPGSLCQIIPVNRSMREFCLAIHVMAWQESLRYPRSNSFILWPRGYTKASCYIFQPWSSGFRKKTVPTKSSLQLADVKM